MRLGLRFSLEKSPKKSEYLLGQSVHLRALQKIYAGILKILIFWPVAPRERFNNSIFGHF